MYAVNSSPALQKEFLPIGFSRTYFEQQNEDKKKDK